MRNNNPFSYWWILILFFVVIGSDSILPLLLIIGVVLFLMYKAVQSSRQADGSTRTRSSSRSSRRTTVHSYGMSDTAHSAASKAKVNAYLMKCFRDGNRSVSLNAGGHQLILSLKTGYRFTSIDSLQADCDGHFFQNVIQFRNAYHDIYNQAFDQLLQMAENDQAVRPDTIVDAEVVGRKEENAGADSSPAEEKATEPKEPDDAESFREAINDLNDAIPDEEISNALYETTNLLKQLGDLEREFPEQKKKLTKLYRNYLPYLIKILQQYKKMQNIQTDSNYKENEQSLKDTINHINAAMKDRLIPSMSESDSINLSADMSTLEAMLRKDGMTGDDDISSMLKKKQGSQE